MQTAMATATTAAPSSVGGLNLTSHSPPSSSSSPSPTTATLAASSEQQQQIVVPSSSSDALDKIQDALHRRRMEAASMELAALRAASTSTANEATSNGHGDDGKDEQQKEDEESQEKASSDVDMETHEASSSSSDKPQVAELDRKLQELHDTLSKLRRESDAKIERLRRESEDASKTIDRLQQQLSRQSDYEKLKREIQSLKQQGGLSLPASTAIPADASSSPSSSSLDMLLALERAKAMQQLSTNQTSAAAALKAFTELQGPAASPFPGLPAPGGALRHPLFPTPTSGASNPGLDALGMVGEEVMAQWRASLAHAGLALPPPPPTSTQLPKPPTLPTAPLTPPTSAVTALPPSASPRESPRPGSAESKPNPPSPSNGTATPEDNNNRPSSANNNGQLANGSSKPPSDVTGSPVRLDSKSPLKNDAPSPLQSPPQQPPTAIPLPPGTIPTPTSIPLPLPLPPLSLVSASRIPKSDPMEGRLQDMLRYNMEKYAGQALDTLATSRRVRELLSVHNIGQRLFAKYVLGLSQGTVSELLSKPKCWEKLTEKGRDSYRKMHAWAYDEQAVMLLKSLIPRKGELMRTPFATAPLMLKGDRFPFNPDGTPANGPGSNPVSVSGPLPPHPVPIPVGPSNGGVGGQDERIAKILSDANKALKEEGGEGNADPENMSKLLYQEELVRIMQQQQKGVAPGVVTRTPEPATSPKVGVPGLDQLALGLPPGLFPGVGGLLQKNNAPSSDFQRAMDVYQNALAAALRAQNGKEEEAKEDAKSVTPPVASSPASSVSPPSLMVKSNLFPPVAPPSADPVAAAAAAAAAMDAANQQGGGGGGSTSLSPLQRMASITNSLVSHPSLPPPNMHGQRQKVPLPPITQQQFDKFQHLNTDETVRRIKEILSQYSISQRLFGESVLGLSQGSVSDLLARPKPWHMLTQKGREPFIRMRLFLDDENAVHKLVASQYKIAPEKLMRTGNYSGCHLPPHAKMPKLPDFPHRPGPLPGFPAADPSVSGGASLAPPPGLPVSRFGLEAPSPSALLDRAGASPLLDPLAIHRKLLTQKLGGGGVAGAPAAAGGLPPPLMGAAAAGGIGGPTPSLYEMAALTHELDTQAVTTKVKEILLANNIGQKLFGEAVLGLSQGSVSELLSKPKPWHMLSIKGREPFIRMQLWLSDPQNIEKLQNVKSDKEAVKRKRVGGGSGSGFDSSSDRSSPVDPGDVYSADSPGSAKKQRLLFSDEQKEALKVAFALDPYPSTSVMEFLGQDLGLESRSVANWFHNHRMRLKQQPTPETLAALAAREGGGVGTFDPVKYKLLCHQRILEMAKEQQESGGEGEVQHPSNSVTSFLRQLGLPTVGVAGGNKTEGGLDLSFKGGRDDGDSRDSIAASSDEEDAKTAVSPAAALLAATAAAAAATGRSSRRKQAAPQWVRAEFAAAAAAAAADNGNKEEDDKGDVKVNGVDQDQEEEAKHEEEADNADSPKQEGEAQPCDE